MQHMVMVGFSWPSMSMIWEKGFLAPGGAWVGLECSGDDAIEDMIQRFGIIVSSQRHLFIATGWRP